MAHPDPFDPVRNAILRQVRAAFNQGKVPTDRTPPSDEALFAKDSPALQGVLDFSNFRKDAEGRFHRTAQFISVTTFGHRERAQEAIERVNTIHKRIEGTLPDGKPYSATDPCTLAWVHIAEATSFLEGYLRHARPDMPLAEQDEYYAQMAVIGRALHADPVPTSVAEAKAILREFRPELTTSKQAREIAQFVLAIRPRGFPAPLQQAIGAEAVMLLPPFARSMLGLNRPGLAALPARATTWGLGKTLRWAMRQ